MLLPEQLHMWCRVSGSLSPGFFKVVDKQYLYHLHNLQKNKGPPDIDPRLLKVTVTGDGDDSKSWQEKGTKCIYIFTSLESALF